MKALDRAWAGVVLTMVLSACSSAAAGSSTPAPTAVTTPSAAASRSEQLFNKTCAACHGERGKGTAVGPPLVHIYYEPNHHADAAFLLAVRNGVVQHHWNFGNMPAQPTVTDAEVREIIAYVRGLQREAGIR